MVRARSGFCDAEGFALDVDTSGLVTTLVVEVLEVELAGDRALVRARLSHRALPAGSWASQGLTSSLVPSQVLW